MLILHLHYVFLLILFFLYRAKTEVVAAEGGRTVFLAVSRSNGLESAVSVEWETQSGTAIASSEISVNSVIIQIIQSVF